MQGSLSTRGEITSRKTIKHVSSKASIVNETWPVMEGSPIAVGTTPEESKREKVVKKGSSTRKALSSELRQQSNENSTSIKTRHLKGNRKEAPFERRGGWIGSKGEYVNKGQRKNRDALKELIVWVDSP